MGESVFAAESIMKRRIRRVLAPLLHPRLRLRALLRNRLFCATAAVNPVITRVCYGSVSFAGSLGISGQMEGLVPEVSTISGGKHSASILAARTTAARQPSARRGAARLADASSFHYSRNVPLIQLMACLAACARLSVLVMIRSEARRDA